MNFLIRPINRVLAHFHCGFSPMLIFLRGFDSFRRFFHALIFCSITSLEIAALISLTTHFIYFWGLAKFFQQIENRIKNYSIFCDVTMLS